MNKESLKHIARILVASNKSSITKLIKNKKFRAEVVRYGEGTVGDGLYWAAWKAWGIKNENEEYWSEQDIIEASNYIWKKLNEGNFTV